MKKVIYGFSLLACLTACQNKEAKTEGVAQANTETPKTAADTTANKNISVNIDNGNATSPNTANPNQTFAAFKFDRMTHDFGKIKEGEIVKYTFKFTNEGSVPLVISDVKASCGCTTPNYTRTPVPPNGRGEIELQFDSTGKTGYQNKSATITANTKEGSAVVSFTVEVEAKAQGGPPVK